MIPFRPINRSCCAAFGFLEREVGGTSSSPGCLVFVQLLLSLW